MTTKTTKRIVTQNPDGTLNIKVVDTRGLKQKLSDIPTFAERLEAMYPTNPVDVTKDWLKFDGHKIHG